MRAIHIARKPFKGPLRDTALEHGTGGLNIRASRIKGGPKVNAPQSDRAKRGAGKADVLSRSASQESFHKAQRESVERTNLYGRWPANVVFEHCERCGADCAPECPVSSLDEQSGHTKSCRSTKEHPAYPGNSILFSGVSSPENQYDDSGGASRYFLCIKENNLDNFHHGKGFRPEPDDPKHWDFAALRPHLILQTLGDVDLRPFTSPRHNQAHTSSCVAQATVKALEIKRIQEHGHDAHIDLSRLAVYYLARELMFPPETHNDDGTYIGHAFDVLRRFGVPTEEDWPWDLDKINTPPSWMAMRKAFRRRLKAFYKIKSEGDERVQDVIAALRAGNPVVFGTETGSNWHRYKAGEVLQLPTRKTGRHATVLVGYKDGVFLGENSWGRNWGSDGFYLMDPSVIASSKSRDFWVPLTGHEPLR